MVMPSFHRALDRDAILRALSSFYGITTGDGDPAGDTLICSALIGSNDFVSTKTILLQSGDSIYESKGATVFNPLTGQITVSPAFSSQVIAGTAFYVLNTAAIAITPILDAITMNQGLVYYGVVTGVPGANQFEIASLAGMGEAKFSTVVPEYQYHAFVLRDASGPGAAPQGESQAVTGYGSVTGTFTANPFSAPVAIGDEILIIHPYLARIMNLYGYPPANGNLAANWNSGVATSGNPGADLVTLGADNVKNKVNSLLVDISGLTVGATITVRLFQLVNGVEREVYSETFVRGTDPDGLWIINGTVGIHEALRVEVHSNNAADDMAIVGYDYMLEAM